MKKTGTARKILTCGLIVLALITAGYFANLNAYKEKYPGFSPKDGGANGVKALYLLAGRMGYATGSFSLPSRFLPDHATLVAVKPDRTVFNSKAERSSLKKWLESGNAMVLVDDSSTLDLLRLEEFSGKPPERDTGAGKGLVYEIGSGALIFLDDARTFTNSGIRDGKAAVRFIDALDRIGNKTVLFDEHYHGAGMDGPDLWMLLGVTGRLFVIQALLGVLVFLLVKSSRLGRPSPVFETVKRVENENLFAVTNIYIKARAYALVLETHLSALEMELSKYLGICGKPSEDEISRAAEENRILRKFNFKNTLKECRSYIANDGKDTGRLLRLVRAIDVIRKEIR